MSGPTAGKSAKSFRRIIGQKRATSLSIFTQNGNSLPGEKQTTFLKRMRREWSNLGEEGRRSFQRKAVLQKQQLPDTQEEKDAYLQRVCRELHTLTDFKKQLGWTFYFKISTGDSTIESPAPQAASAAPIAPSAPIAPTASSIPQVCQQSNYPERRNLRRRVQNLFNGLYQEATGNQENFPYKRHQRKPELVVTGMPHGVPFREPFTYGLPALHSILKQSSFIKMVPLHTGTTGPVTPACLTASADVSTTGPVTPACLTASADVSTTGPVTPACLTASADVREVSLWEQFTAAASSVHEDHSVALSPHGSGDVAVIAEVMEVTPCGEVDISGPPLQDIAEVLANVEVVEVTPFQEDISAPPAQDIVKVLAHVNVVHPPVLLTEETCGVIDVPAVLESKQRPQEGHAKVSAKEKAGTQKSMWTAEEEESINKHFAEELSGRRIIRIHNIKNFITSCNFQRTPFAVQNYLLRKRKENSTKAS